MNLFNSEVFSSSKFLAPGKVDIIRSNIVCSGSTKNDAGRLNVFNSFLEVPRASKENRRAPRTVSGIAQRYFRKNSSSKRINRLSLQPAKLVRKFGLWRCVHNACKESQSCELRCKRSPRLPRSDTLLGYGLSASCTSVDMTAYLWAAVPVSCRVCTPECLRFSFTETILSPRTVFVPSKDERYGDLLVVKPDSGFWAILLFCSSLLSRFRIVFLFVAVL